MVKEESPISIEIRDVMARMVGSDISEAMINSAKKFDDPDENGKDFFESCKKLFSGLIGQNIVERKLQPIKDKYFPASKEKILIISSPNTL